MSRATPEQMKQMKKDMKVVFDHFALAPLSRKVAKESAERRALKAYRCYRAIAASLEPR